MSLDQAAITAMGSELMKLGAERLNDLLPSRLSGAPPASADLISSAWLSEHVASNEAFRGAGITNVDCIDANSGTTDRARLKITYSSRTEPYPPTVFVKLSPRSFINRLFGNLMRLATNEARFYREIAPAISIRVPTAFAIEEWGPASRLLLVLEDLSLLGAAFPTVGDRVSLEQAKAVMATFANLHAAYADDPRFDQEFSWLRSPGRNPTEAIERMVCAFGVKRGLLRFADVVPEPLHRNVERILAARPHLERQWSVGTQTLIHGDAHVGNMFFLDDGDDPVGFLDWQVVQVGQGMRDVSYFLINSVPTETRREHEGVLINGYRERMVELGAKMPFKDELRRQYRLHSLYAWIGAAVTAASGTMQPKEIARAGLTRTCRAVMDLGALGALDDLGV